MCGVGVFDAVIILASFVVDLVFLKGLQAFPLDDSIFILAFLLPWRVIRVVNSLVVAVIDHEHVKLRLLYSRKKKLDKTVDNLRNEVDELKGMLQDVRSFCIRDGGIAPEKIDPILGKFAPRRRKDSKFYTLVKLVMSTASVADDRDSISSSTIENDIRAIANRDSVLNINDYGNSNENISNYHFLDVPGHYDCRSMSDTSSYRGGYSPSQSPDNSPTTSPCPTPTLGFLRVPTGPSVFKFDETQSLTSATGEGMASRPCTPNILLTVPSSELAWSEGEETAAETHFGGSTSTLTKRPTSLGANGVGVGVGVGRHHRMMPSPPSSPFLAVPTGLTGRSRISDSHSLTDLHDVSRSGSSRRASCLSLNADAKGRRRRSPRRVNFNLS
ncbi:hypothetical protein ACOMHN_001491 [Nucella lapillus]